MTENEAVKVFKKPTKHIKKFLLNGEETICYSTDMVKAFEMAIQALEEIQQYRAIGTVEKIQKKMEEHDKICNKAIDEYVRKLKRVRGFGLITNFGKPFGITFNKLDEIAEELRGDKNQKNK